jgi:DNA-binding beta-propeller fold protein YncE
MQRRAVTFMVFAVSLVIAFLVGNRLVPVSAQQQAPAYKFAAVPGEKGGQDILGAYEVVQGWPKPMSTIPGHDPHWGWSAIESIFAQNPNKVFIVQRGELPVLPDKAPQVLIGPSLAFPVGQYPWRNASQGPNSAAPGGFGEMVNGERLPHYVLPVDSVDYPLWKGKMGVDARWEHCIVVVDAQGNILPETENWKQWDHLFGYPHDVVINPYDPEKHVWIVEAARHMVYEFTNDGKTLVKQIGTPNEPGADKTHFNRPTFLGWLPEGTMFLTDGYYNTRVVKFDKDGNYLMEWGKRGVVYGKETRPGYMNIVHGLAIDPVTRRLYVNDRGNRRIQVFDENGKFLDMWKTGTGPAGDEVSTIYTIYYSDGKVWGADERTRRIIGWDTNGYLQYAWGGQGQWFGSTDGIHGMSVDQDQNVYLADLYQGRAMKYRPRPGANPNYLLGKPVRAAWKD